MSISPNDAQRSQFFSSLKNPNPSPNHGALDREPRSLLDPQQIERLSLHAARGGGDRSGHVSAEERGGDEAREISVSAVEISGGSHDSSKNGTEHSYSDTGKGSYDQSNDTFSEGPSIGRRGVSSEFGSDQPGPQISRRPSGSGKTFQSDPSSTASRRNQVGNANHLLNFYYDPISRPPPRAPPPRRQRKIKPYNKDLFLQANYKFVVLDTGSYQVDTMDPDKMLQWEDIICVKYSTPFPAQCPICLEIPLCPQITSCGHIYCFPCILRYLLMGKEDHKGDCWKKCPLCFMMISSKDLCTIQIENVKQLHVGDHIDFTLLTRRKDSLVPVLKNQQDGPTEFSNNEMHDSFSKFTLTSDVNLFAQEPILDLKDWLIRAESGLVDELERLPYVCAALDQLEERIKLWMDQPTLSTSPPLRNSASGPPNYKVINTPIKRASSVLISTSTSDHGKSIALESGSLEKGILFDEDKTSNSSSDAGERDSYTFYQAIDGQHIILHPLNMKCLLHHYGSYEMLPQRIRGQILEMELLTQSEAIRKRYRFLSHFSLTTSIQLCEIDIGELLTSSSLAPFKDEIKKREKQRKQVARKERNEKARAEAAALDVMPIISYHNYSPSVKDATFSSDDFEALVSGVAPSTSPPINSEKKKFSDVTRLGFAAAHDSPSLKAEGSADPSRNAEKMGNSSNTPGARPTTLSFADIMSAPKATCTPAVQTTNGVGKKGKKPTKVLLSTAGGRRY